MFRHATCLVVLGVLTTACGGGSATPTGTCEGTVLTLCYDGALANVDCATSQQTCGPVPGAGAEHDCL